MREHGGIYVAQEPLCDIPLELVYLEIFDVKYNMGNHHWNFQARRDFTLVHFTQNVLGQLSVQ